MGIFPKAGQPICAPETMGGPGTRTCAGGFDPDMKSCEGGLQVKPTQGSVLLWYNFHPNGRGDRNALHAGCPPGKGETKWSANKWFSIKPLNTPPSKWFDDHPALRRFGYKAKAGAPDPNACDITFTDGASEAVDVMWRGTGGLTRVQSVRPGTSEGLSSFKGHSFVLQAGSRQSDVAVCSKAKTIFSLSADFVLQEGS